MKFITVLSILFFLIIGYSGAQSNSQEFPPRLKWLGKLEVENISEAEGRVMIDTLDLRTYNEYEIKILTEFLGNFEKKWLDVHRPKLPEVTNPSMTIYVGGLSCDECIDRITNEIELIEGVDFVTNVDLKTDYVEFQFEQDLMGKMEDIVVGILSPRLPEYDIIGVAKSLEEGTRRVEESIVVKGKCPIHDAE